MADYVRELAEIEKRGEGNGCGTSATMEILEVEKKRDSLLVMNGYNLIRKEIESHWK